MAEGGENQGQVIKNAPNILKADLWAHFRFYELVGKHKLDKTSAVGKVCHTKTKHLRNTTNLRNHVSCFHSEKLMLGTVKKNRRPNQQLMRRCQLCRPTLKNGRESPSRPQSTEQKI